ncbi:hypothetical protein [Anaeroselena agilis]|uniref:ATP-dependent DNA ligase family profile domain-containing protein n=1 Tax=Anaeroselena agilis TaxID=3063788 RepID=A0ABU3NUY7_9FIRM|nr:hypothetical protein [Selenomonadales bacterium 4137-cl]
MDFLALTGRPKDKFIQFALDFNKVKHPERLTFPRLASEKIDGVFCLAHRHEGDVTIYSRTGEVYTSMRHIEEALKDILEDGEIVIFEACGPMGTPQPVVSGWCRDTKEQHPELMAGCHDYIYIKEFLHGGHVLYHRRHAILKACVDNWRAFKATKATYWTLFCIAQKPVVSLDEAKAYAEEIWAGGGEGVVLRNPDAVYQPGKRNDDIIKIKKGVSYDLEVVGLKEGKGKYKDTLGTLVCRWKDGKTIEISGMTDEQRRWWWKYPHMIVGKVVQVDAMCESSKGLLREPRFKGPRWDKEKGDF